MSIYDQLHFWGWQWWKNWKNWIVVKQILPSWKISQNPKRWIFFGEVSKNQNNHHHRGHAPFSKCPVNSRRKRKTFYKVVSDHTRRVGWWCKPPFHWWKWVLPAPVPKHNQFLQLMIQVPNHISKHADHHQFTLKKSQSCSVPDSHYNRNWQHGLLNKSETSGWLLPVELVHQ